MSDDLFDVVGEAPTDDETKTTIALRVHVQPGAGRSSVVGRYGDALHVRVAPPPVDGRANVACQELLAELFGVPNSAVELSAGEHSRQKRFRVAGIALGDARRRIARALEDAGPTARRGRESRR